MRPSVLACCIATGAIVAGGLLVLACGADTRAESAIDPYGPAMPNDADPKSAERLACQFNAGDPTATTLGPRAAAGVTKIEHVVVVMLENRSFDHLLGDLRTLPAADRPPGVSMPGPGGGLHPRYHEDAFCPDGAELPRHEWGDTHLQLAEGRMDGFVTASDCRALGYYDANDLPVLHALAENGAVSARYFSSLLGPTWPNRLFLFTGTSCGFAEGFETNVEVTTKCGLTRPSWFTHLDDVELFDESGVTAVAIGLGLYKGKPRSIADFQARAAAGRLPKISFVGASTGVSIPVLNPAPPEDDGHPPSDIRRIEPFLHDVVGAVLKSPQWSSTALFITFDEHGGYWDHVKPPRACPPHKPIDAGPDAGEDDTVRDHAFDQFGFRVPLILVSPYARAAYVGHVDADHTSLLRFLELLQGKGALTARDANAWPLLDLFDFEQTPRAPFVLPPRLVPPPCDKNIAPKCLRDAGR